MAANHSDRLDRIERIQERNTELIAASWEIIRANTELITQMIERQERMDERQQRTQEQLDQLSRDIGFLFASFQGHMAQPHPPAHAGETRSAGE